MAKRPLVDFFIAGVQKGGTTGLDRLLRDHPRIRMARVKEPHFFDDENIDWSKPDLTVYHSQFDVADEERVMVGEATPILSYWPGALQRVANYNSEARIIISLRHPTFRAYSHWRMEWMRKADDLPFADAVREPGRARVRTALGGVHRVFSYVERGLYANQIDRVLRLFPRRSVLFLRADRLWRNPNGVLHLIYGFLGVPPRPGAAVPTYSVPIDTRKLGPMQPQERRYLDAYYSEDIRRTAELTSLDLEDWLDPLYDEPMGANER